MFEYYFIHVIFNEKYYMNKNNFTPLGTLRRKLNDMTKRFNDCQAELRELKKELKAATTSTNKNLNNFRKAVGSTSTNHSHKKRRLNRGSSPNKFWDLFNNNF